MPTWYAVVRPVAERPVTLTFDFWAENWQARLLRKTFTLFFSLRVRSPGWTDGQKDVQDKMPEPAQYKIAVLVYKVLQWLAPQYLGPLNYVTVTYLPGRRPLRSAGTNRLAVPPVKLTTVAHQPGFPGCRPTDMERFTRRRDFSPIVIHLPSAT